MIYITIVVIIFFIFVLSTFVDAGTALILFMVLMLIVLPLIVSYSSHAEDLGRISAQHYVIAVQEERIERLTTTLSNITLPKDSVALLNADSPVSTIVHQLAIAERELAEAKTQRAEAIVSIEQRRNGLFSIIVSINGDGSENL